MCDQHVADRVEVGDRVHHRAQQPGVRRDDRLELRAYGVLGRSPLDPVRVGPRHQQPVDDPVGGAGRARRSRAGRPRGRRRCGGRGRGRAGAARSRPPSSRPSSWPDRTPSISHRAARTRPADRSTASGEPASPVPNAAQPLRRMAAVVAWSRLGAWMWPWLGAALALLDAEQPAVAADLQPGLALDPLGGEPFGGEGRSASVDPVDARPSVPRISRSIVPSAAAPSVSSRSRSRARPSASRGGRGAARDRRRGVLDQLVQQRHRAPTRRTCGLLAAAVPGGDVRRARSRASRPASPRRHRRRPWRRRARRRRSRCRPRRSAPEYRRGARSAPSPSNAPSGAR